MAEALGYIKPQDEACINHGEARPQRVNYADGSPLRQIQRGSCEPPFFCVHPVAGGAIQYAQLALHLGPQQTFYGLEGLDPDEPYIEIEERAADYIKAIRSAQGRGPYILSGWSFGGLVAFEMAQRLLRDGQEVALLALFDPMPPIESHGKPCDIALDSDDPVLLVEQIIELAGWDSQLPYNLLRRAPRDEQLKQIIAMAKTTPIIPPEIGPESVINWLRGFRAKLKSARNYVPQVYKGRITLFKVDHIANANQPDNGSSLDPENIWAALSSDPVEVYKVSGTHHTMILEPHVRGLAHRLRACIDKAVAYNFKRKSDEMICRS
jgi:thioesterase domain-containing protein